MHCFIVGSILALDVVEIDSHSQLAATKRATATNRKKLAMNL